MSLVGNLTLQNGRCATSYQGATVPHGSFRALSWARYAFGGQDASGATATSPKKLVAVPSGYYPGVAWQPPVTAGGVSARVTDAEGSVTSANAAGGLAAAADLAGAGTLDGLGSLIVSAAAALVGVGGVTGNVRAALLASADLAGSGDLSGAVVALGHALAAISGSGTLSPTVAATGAASADLVGGAQVGQVEISEAQVVAIAAAVWAAACEGSLDYQGVQRILLAVAAGKTDINTSGPSPVVTFRDQADTTDRVTATMNGSERATVVLDPS